MHAFVACKRKYCFHHLCIEKEMLPFFADHNRVHAADVMHATYYFTTNKLCTYNDGVPMPPAQSRRSRANSECIDECIENDPEHRAEHENRLSKLAFLARLKNGIEIDYEDDAHSGTLASIMSSLELMALYTAAAMHDYDHPGRTNAFLVAIEDRKAILYNDRSVLENHHAASSWQLLCRSENNFVEHLDAAEFKRFRYIIIEAILATDLKRHFEILLDFNGKVSFLKIFFKILFINFKKYLV
jgi:hypothetical protein